MYANSLVSSSACMHTFQFYASLQDDKHPIVHRDYRLMGQGKVDKEDDKGVGQEKRKGKERVSQAES